LLSTVLVFEGRWGVAGVHGLGYLQTSHLSPIFRSGLGVQRLNDSPQNLQRGNVAAVFDLRDGLPDRVGTRIERSSARERCGDDCVYYAGISRRDEGRVLAENADGPQNVAAVCASPEREQRRWRGPSSLRSLGMTKMEMAARGVLFSRPCATEGCRVMSGEWRGKNKSDREVPRRCARSG
jgi:hypothetical protein